MKIVFCVDKKMVAPLHVAASSVLESLSATVNDVSFDILSSDLDESDVESLRQTLNNTGRQCRLKLYSVDASSLSSFPDLQNSHATYLRLLIPDIITADRFLYLDVDILCRTDLSSLYKSELNGYPIGLVPEAPISSSPDPDVAILLGTRASGNYYNAGVMLVDVNLWREQDITMKCLDFITVNRPRYHDQSALNFVLHGNIQDLALEFNSRTNDRRNWSALIPPHSGEGRLLHFVDYPKPWSTLGRWAHPMGRLWWKAYANTYHSRLLWSLQNMAKKPRDDILSPGYRKILKDKLLFKFYSLGLPWKVKGTF